MDEKVQIVEEAKDKHCQPSSTNRTTRDLDQAFFYVQGSANGNNAYAASASDLKSLRRRIDWHIVPIMFCCYTMQFIDKVLLNYAAVMGLNKDLELKGNDFTNAATAFFIAYLVAEVPNAIVLQKVPAAKWLSANVILWGIATACTAAARSYRTLLTARIFLGIFEAAIAPSLMLISSQWYTKSEQAPRFSIWYAGLGVGQIIGGVLSYAFQQVRREGRLEGWRIMFVVLGVVTVVIGVATGVWLPDTPMQAGFLGEGEKVVLLRHVAVNQTGIRNRGFKAEQVLEVLRDAQMWLMTLLVVLISISSGVVTTYSATLIRNFGFSPPNSALLNTPSGLVSIATILVVGYGVRYTSHRWAWLVLCCIPGVLGGALLSFATHNRAAQLAGIYLVNTITATLAIIYQWTASNVAGQTKRVVAVALIAGSFSVGNIIGPQTFQARDAPGYIPAKITVLATQAAAAGVAAVLFGYYVWANRGKDKKMPSDVAVAVEGQSEGGDFEGTEQRLWEDRTDKENEMFRYVY